MKTIAFYLPQYHPIPENDAWWGKGFTEWTNVAKARPLFLGHHQPQIPADLGFYDLRLEETRIAQAELAREYGIGGFCYYHYWFNGKMLLERPFNDVLTSSKPDFPFCLCWANENWTRRWDGLEQEILMRQNYDDYDPIQHAQWLVQAFKDQRYIKISGRPLFLVYRADHLKNIRNVLAAWKAYALESGFPGLYVCAVKNNQYKLSDAETIEAGFDAIVEFQPNPSDLKGAAMNLKTVTLVRKLNAILEKLNLPRKSDYVRYDYSKVVEAAIKKSPPAYKTFPCIFPNWDNTSRRRFGITVIQNDDATLYAKWLESSMMAVENNPEDEKIVFVNAWNEWAEGCHLEPDTHTGRKFLEATLETLNNFLPKNTQSKSEPT
ncbi:glycosyl hydrolase [Oryzomonas sagensis]|uniref:Glycosyl hydrolase n=1 Tax=Oryzomonas sagensis TaxID=2603857 RepID=A0ABQ6TTI6_9BACT|nr:glycoside hydrolase family 99-like domain-containing protein [Oryzomonas sagensis]KAB0672328.1 glycosyl hydrolase [Oryzomonas sagensis]